MKITFKLSPSEVRKFKKLVTQNKEYGGVLNIKKNRISNVSAQKGGNYSISYNYKNENYEYSYHTHAYSPKFKHVNKDSVVKNINEMMDYDLNEALYIFECDIMKIHPPSPQDCYVCSISKKQGMIVFTQEGVYQLHYTGMEPMTLDCKDKIDKYYYKCIWGKSRKWVTKCLEGDNEDILKCIKGCLKYRKSSHLRDNIVDYLKFLKENGIECKLIPWKKASEWVFFSNK